VTAYETGRLGRRRSESRHRSASLDRHYGARWGRAWLDVARTPTPRAYVFIETANIPGHTYRDYVVR